MHRFSDCARESISRDDQARGRPKFGLSAVKNLVTDLEAFPPGAHARFLLERTPFLIRRSFPGVPGGISVQFSDVPRPAEFDCLFDLGDLAPAMVSVRLELALRGGHSSELVGPYTPTLLKALVSSFAGMFRDS